MSISVYPIAREKRNGDEGEREGISRHYRIHDSHVYQLSSLIKKKKRKKRKKKKKKSTCLRQKIRTNVLLFTLYSCDIGKGA